MLGMHTVPKRAKHTGRKVFLNQAAAAHARVKTNYNSYCHLQRILGIQGVKTERKKIKEKNVSIQ